MKKRKVYAGVALQDDGTFYAICPRCQGSGAPCELCHGDWESWALSKVGGFPVEVLHKIPDIIEGEEYEQIGV
jgi:hypothetical protein